MGVIFMMTFFRDEKFPRIDDITRGGKKDTGLIADLLITDMQMIDVKMIIDY